MVPILMVDYESDLFAKDRSLSNYGIIIDSIINIDDVTTMTAQVGCRIQNFLQHYHYA